jgi:hypothetical protein
MTKLVKTAQTNDTNDAPKSHLLFYANFLIFLHFFWIFACNS